MRTFTNIIMFHFPINVCPSCSKYETKRKSHCVYLIFYISLLKPMNSSLVSNENGTCLNVSNGFVYS